MRYEKELMELLPMLRNYLKKIMWKYTGAIEDEEVFSRCVEKIITVTEKRKNIRNPEKFMTGVFRRTAEDIKQAEIVESKRKLPLATPVEISPAAEIINALDGQFTGTTKSIWNTLKENMGNNRMTMKQLGIKEPNFYYHKKKLRDYYRELVAV